MDAAFDDGADPRGLIRDNNVAWIVSSEDRGTPRWAIGVDPEAQFGSTVVLRADRSERPERGP